MQGWSAGYVTDIEYGDDFQLVLSPSRMTLAATINGVEAPDLAGAFAYCELGCGRGQTSLALAAMHPQAEFHAVDFNPAHIALARLRAQQAGLANIAFHELSFSDLNGGAGGRLPMMDVIASHGVWSWIAPSQQESIVAFADSHLNAGGLVYVGYNALPGWSQVAPLQRLIRELAAERPGRSDHAIAEAIRTLLRLAEAKMVPERLADGVTRIKSVAAQNMFTYLAHEYLNEHWRPCFHWEVAREMAGAKLTYAASTDLLRNFQNVALSPDQSALLEEIGAPSLRETLKDFATDTWFRQDVFVRGARRMSGERRRGLLEALTLNLVRAPPQLLQFNRPDGTAWRPEPAVYGPALEALRASPRRVAELIALPELPPNHSVSALELVGVLVGAELALPRRDVSAAATAACDRLNAQGRNADDDALASPATIVAPALDAAFTLSPIDLALYVELREGRTPDPASLAERFVSLCQRRGTHPIVGGTPIEDAAEARGALTEEYVQRIEGIVPLWRMMGLA